MLPPVSVYVSKLLWQCPSGNHKVYIHTPPPVLGWDSLATLEDRQGNIIAIDFDVNKEWKNCVGGLCNA